MCMCGTAECARSGVASNDNNTREEGNSSAAVGLLSSDCLIL
jgi:hypothetical protein